MGVSADGGNRAISPVGSRPASGSRARPGTSGEAGETEEGGEDEEEGTEEQREALAAMKELVEDWKKNRVADVSEHRFPVLLQQVITLTLSLINRPLPP